MYIIVYTTIVVRLLYYEYNIAIMQLACMHYMIFNLIILNHNINSHNGIVIFFILYNLLLLLLLWLYNVIIITKSCDYKKHEYYAGMLCPNCG